MLFIAYICITKLSYYGIIGKYNIFHRNVHGYIVCFDDCSAISIKTA